MQVQSEVKITKIHDLVRFVVKTTMDSLRITQASEDSITLCPQGWSCFDPELTNKTKQNKAKQQQKAKRYGCGERIWEEGGAGRKRVTELEYSQVWNCQRMEH